jgi:hypothetical protein
MNRATVTCGCGASAVFEDWLPSTTDAMVDGFNKAHAECRIARRDYRPAIEVVPAPGDRCGGSKLLANEGGRRCPGCRACA